MDFVSSIGEVHFIVLHSRYNDAAICMGAKRERMYSYFHMNVSLSTPCIIIPSVPRFSSHKEPIYMKAKNLPFSSIKIMLIQY